MVLRGPATIAALALACCRAPATVEPVVPARPPSSMTRPSSAAAPADEVAPDLDHDGRAGADDRCPDRAETYEGTEDDDGCPDAPSSVRFSDDGRRIELLEPVRWRNAETGLLEDPQQAVLRHLAALLTALPDLHIEVQAHEPPREEIYGRKPTDRQARAVANWLIAHGIARDRIRATGYGSDRPIADNSTPAGREANLRIEIVVVRSGGAEP